ncbi:MAG TPA: alpha/beta hydrolase [Leptolyngbyaceae cyanobacterium M65_K2018_010]|nr:alpha/beta hydrolase [Leptolyngbyaceae cyanobacterium M65_K2018_010]
MATTAIFGVPHYYNLSGSQPTTPIVFVHGWLLSHRYWQPLVDQLATYHPCLVYDLRGFGESRQGLDQYQPGLPAAAEALPTTPSAYGLAAYARDLAALVQKLELGPVWVVGHSLGGSIALWAAHCYPDLIQGVIGLNAGGGIYLERDFQQFRQVGQQIVRWRSPWLRYLPILSLALTRATVAQPLPYRWGQQRRQDLLEAHPEAAIGSLLESTTEAEVHLLPRIVSALSQPVYFLAGCEDPVMELKFVNHLAGYLPSTGMGQAAVIELANCGHMAMLEQTQVVAKTILDLLGH